MTNEEKSDDQWRKSFDFVLDGASGLVVVMKDQSKNSILMNIPQGVVNNAFWNIEGVWKECHISEAFPNMSTNSNNWILKYF